jgi:hypothetical protein
MSIVSPIRSAIRCGENPVSVRNIMDSYKFNSGGFTYSDHLTSKPFRIEKEKSINRVSHFKA